MSAPIKRYAPTCDCMSNASWGDYVLHSDHIASHAFDEAKERELFEAWFTETYTAHRLGPRLTNCGIATDGYADSRVDICWRGWLACARSRAERFAGGAE